MSIESAIMPPHLNDDLLNAWLDGETTEAETGTVLSHLAGCHQCQTNLDSLRMTKEILAGLSPVEAPRSFTLSPSQAAGSGDSGNPSKLIRLLPMTRMLSVAAVIAFLVLGSANIFGPVFTEQDATNDSAAPANTMLSARGAPPEDNASEDAEFPVFSASALPGNVVDQGASATSSNEILIPTERVASDAESTSTLSRLQIAWITSGAIAVISIVAWVGIRSLAPAPQTHRA